MYIMPYYDMEIWSQIGNKHLAITDGAMIRYTPQLYFVWSAK